MELHLRAMVCDCVSTPGLEIGFEKTKFLGKPQKSKFQLVIVSFFIEILWRSYLILHHFCSLKSKKLQKFSKKNLGPSLVQSLQPASLYCWEQTIILSSGNLKLYSVNFTSYSSQLILCKKNYPMICRIVLCSLLPLPVRYLLRYYCWKKND